MQASRIKWIQIYSQQSSKWGPSWCFHSLLPLWPSKKCKIRVTAWSKMKHTMCKTWNLGIQHLFHRLSFIRVNVQRQCLIPGESALQSGFGTQYEPLYYQSLFLALEGWGQKQSLCFDRSFGFFSPFSITLLRCLNRICIVSWFGFGSCLIRSLTAVTRCLGSCSKEK